jgi:hypothetical protein
MRSSDPKDKIQLLTKQNKTSFCKGIGRLGRPLGKDAYSYVSMTFINNLKFRLGLICYQDCKQIQWEVKKIPGELDRALLEEYPYSYIWVQWFAENEINAQ